LQHLLSGKVLDISADLCFYLGTGPPQFAFIKNGLFQMLHESWELKSCQFVVWFDSFVSDTLRLAAKAHKRRLLSNLSTFLLQPRKKKTPDRISDY